MFIVVVALLSFVAVPVTPIHHDIHKRMTEEEVLAAFQTDHANVPSYEVVRIESSRIDKRDTRFGKSLQITSSNKRINMMLNPTDGYLAGIKTPVTIARALSDGSIEYTDDLYAMKKAGQLMENSETMSSFVVSETSSGRDAFNGYIGSHNMVVRSLPEHLFEELSRKARSVDDSVSSDAVYHVMYEAEKRAFKPNISVKRMNETRLQLRSIRNKRDIPEIIYPEVLIVADYTTYRLHGSKVENVVRYLLALWNSVDLRYRLLTEPKIRLNIARIIIAEEPEGTPYMFVGGIDGQVVHADNAIEAAGKHFYSQRKRIPLNSYDALMMMTKLKLTAKDGRNPGGVAHMGEACRINRLKRQFMGTGIYMDVGAYESIRPAHELGHILGADHDETEQCPSDKGYVMAPVPIDGLNSWTFSSCSINYFRAFLSSKTKYRYCLDNVPTSTGKLLRRIIAKGGSATSIDEQCQKMGFPAFCPHESLIEKDICVELVCQDKADPDACTDGIGSAAVEGTPCNGNGFCLGGRCV